MLGLKGILLCSPSSECNGTAEQIWISGQNTLLTQAQVLTHAELTFLVLEQGLWLKWSSPCCTGMKTFDCIYSSNTRGALKHTVIFLLYRLLGSLETNALPTWKI